MKIIVCIKQVPGTQKVTIDEKTGSLIRSGVEAKMNPYDLHAIEAAMEIKEALGAEITALTMGPPSAKEILYEAFSLGVDEGILLSDFAFAGSDVLASSRALSQCIRLTDFDLILCGKQTTDGDTAQVGPAIAEFLNIPHVSWVKRICKLDEKGITLEQDLNESILSVSMNYPCLITVEASLNRPRLPSYLLKQKSKNRPIKTYSLQDLRDKDKNNYGMLGSPTSVERIFTPSSTTQTHLMEAEPEKMAESLKSKLIQLKFV